MPETDGGVLLPTEPPDDTPGGILLPETSYEQLMAVSIEADPGFRRIPQDQWPDLIAQKYNTSYWVTTILSQGSVGSCASEAKDGGVMVIREKHGQHQVEFNAYGTYGRVNGGQDRGSSLSANLAFGRNRGCFPGYAWPRSKGWRAEPSAEAYQEASKYRILEYFRIPTRDWDAFGSALLQGYCVYWGYTGHAIVACDLVSTEKFRYLNSWGESWGQASPHSDRTSGGFGIARDVDIEWAYGAYAFQAVTLDQDEKLTTEGDT